MKEAIETRKTEVRNVTSNTIDMLHKFTTGRIVKSYAEDFTDEETGEVVSIDRNEILFERATLIDQDVLQKILFYMQAGDIKEVEVSNQRRAAFHVENTYLRPFISSVLIGNKKHKMLFYAQGVESAVQILKDYIELNYSAGFAIRSISDYSADLVLVDNLVPLEKHPGENDDDLKDKKFYQIEFTVNIDEEPFTSQLAIVHTESVDRAMMLINDYFQKRERERVEKQRKEGLRESERIFTAVLEAAKQIPVKEFIPREFSEAYAEETEKDSY